MEKLGSGFVWSPTSSAGGRRPTASTPSGTWAGSSIGHGHDRRRGRPGPGAPGQPLPAGGHAGPGRDQLRGVVGGGRGDAAVPVRRRRRRDPGRRCRSTTPGSGTASSRASAPARPTATAPPAPGTRPAGCAATRPSCCSTPTPGPPPGRCGSARRSSATTPPIPTGRASSTRPRTSPGAWSSTRPSTGPAAPATAAPLRRHRRLRGARQGVHHAPSRACPPELRGTYAGLGHEAARRPPGRPRGDRGRAAAGAPARARGVPAGAGADQLLGLQHHRVLRARTTATRPPSGPAAPAARWPSSRRWSPPCTRAGLEVRARRGVQPHRRGRPARADAVPPRPGQPRLLPAGPGRPPPLRRHHRHAATPLNAGDPVCLQLIMDSLRYWLTEMGVDGFRFDLAPTLARQDGGFDRMSAFFDLVAQDPVVSRAKLIAEPWDVGQPDSYDVGRFPPGWSEWNGRYRDTHAGLLAPPGRARRRVRDPLQRLVGPVRRLAPAAHRLGQPRHRARRLHAARTWCPTTASTTRPTARPTGTGPTTTAPGTAGWRARRDDPEVRRAPRPAVPGAADHPAAVVRGAAAARRRRARPHPGRQQQRLLPGQRDLLVRLVAARRRPAGLHPAPGRAAARAPGVPPAPLPRRDRGVRAGLVHARRPRP